MSNDDLESFHALLKLAVTQSDLPGGLVYTKGLLQLRGCTECLALCIASALKTDPDFSALIDSAVKLAAANSLRELRGLYSHNNKN